MKTKINQLISYANEKQLLDYRDNAYMYNSLCYLLNVKVDATFIETKCDMHIDDLLDAIASAYQQFETNTEK